MQSEEEDRKFKPRTSSKIPKCCLCRTSEVDILNLGEIQMCKSYNCHYFCLLLSTKLVQNGADEHGISGFLPMDIRKELRRTKLTPCYYCEEPGASIHCNKCSIKFHLPCGIKNNTNHEFHGNFVSQCHIHRPVQIFVESAEPTPCTICYDLIDVQNADSDVIWTPCCKKRSYFHRPCLQQLALSTGFFFKCPICANNSIFNRTVKNFGVFVPNRDASWEFDRNTFIDIQYRFNECNAEVCKCRKGRNYSTPTGSWTILRCLSCEVKGTHVYCSNVRRRNEWHCDACKTSPHIFHEGPSTSGTQYTLMSSNLSTASSSDSLWNISLPSYSFSTSNLNSSEGNKNSEKVDEDFVDNNNSSLLSEPTATSIAECPSSSCSNLNSRTTIADENESRTIAQKESSSKDSGKGKKRKLNPNTQLEKEICCSNTSSHSSEDNNQNYKTPTISEENPSSSYSPRNTGSTMLHNQDLPSYSCSQSVSSTSHRYSELLFNICANNYISSNISASQSASSNYVRTTDSYKKTESTPYCCQNTSTSPSTLPSTSGNSSEIQTTMYSSSLSSTKFGEKSKVTWATPSVSDRQLRSSSTSNLNMPNIVNATGSSNLNSSKESGRGKKRKRSFNKTCQKPSVSGPHLRSRSMLNLSRSTTMSMPSTSRSCSDILNTTNSGSFNFSKESGRGKKGKKSGSKKLDKKEEEVSNENKPASNSTSSEANSTEESL